VANWEPHRGNHRTGSALFALKIGALLALLLSLTAGCNHGPPMAQVTGKVIYNGKPLEFGAVMFQPPHGQPARGDIQPDGTFTLSTYRLNDGVVLGKHKVRIACYETQRPGTVRPPGEVALGKLLIPAKYTTFERSGFTADVHEGENPPITFELKGPPG
jgi:hypothetical protein